MAIRKYTNGAWVPTTYRKYGTETDTIMSLPAQIIGDGQPITSCQISGNTVQNGTPTPEAPVDVVGCGVRTRNLFDGVYPNIRTDVPEYRSIFVGDGEFTLSTSTDRYGTAANLFFLAGRVTSGATTSTNGVWKGSPRTITSLGGYVTIAYRYYNDEKSDPRFNTAMLNTGSTYLPYKPYGYKLPLTVNGVEYPIYLGQVQTTRRIKKLELTGEENVDLNNVDRNRLIIQAFYSLPRTGTTTATNIICSHLKTLSAAEATAAEQGITMRYNGTDILFGIPFSLIGATTEDSNATIRAKIKSYLAAQYANGTPVTVWFVLATPETGIVNEPLMKIGDYADTVSATNIPTTGTPENFDVGTTLKPSEVSLTYHGWHEHTDTKYTE